MKILDRYIARWVIGGVLLTLSVLLAVFMLFSFVEQVGDLGRGDFGVLSALEYTLLTMPRQATELFPAAALVGSLLSLGVLASASELTVMRAAGISPRRLSLSVMKGGAVLMLIAVVVGELVTPYAEEFARDRRAAALAEGQALRSGRGFWIRDGANFIHVREVLPSGELLDVRIYELAADSALRSASRAARGVYRDGVWILEDLRRSEFAGDAVQPSRQPRGEWHSALVPALVEVALVSPERLTALGLARYARYLRDNGQDAGLYELALWNKLMTPLTTGVMIFLAIPFVFGPLRSVGVGQRVLVGAMVGIVFHIIGKVSSQAALVYGFSPFLSATLPTLLVLGGAWWLMRRV